MSDANENRNIIIIIIHFERVPMIIFFPVFGDGILYPPKLNNHRMLS